MNHFIVVREESVGKFIAYPAGLPELTASATTRADAILAATEKMNEWYLAGNIVWMRLPGRGKSQLVAEPDDESRAYMQRAYEEALEQSRREDLERTLAEYEAECRSTSSTPTT
jgi:hypothetical protein